jgi:fermentation-respiration switch protein FrsA (DUF1100 family)/LysM repeat protein
MLLNMMLTVWNKVRSVDKRFAGQRSTSGHVIQSLIGWLLCVALLTACNLPEDQATPPLFEEAEPTPEVIVVTATPLTVDSQGLPAPPETPVLAPTEGSTGSGGTVHIVAAGDTLLGIAAQYGLTLDALLAANNIANPNTIEAGQELIIPAADSAASPDLQTTPTGAAQGEEEAADSPSPIDSANPLADYTIDMLSTRSYYGGTIVKEGINVEANAYTQYVISYDSDGIYVTGLMNVPKDGEGPWPVIIVLHGGIDQSSYQPGDGTFEHGDFFARHGYVVFMPDYRSYNDTEGSGSPLKIPWVIDIMNLIAALPTAPEADPSRVGVMGQSRGGGLAGYIMVISDVQAVSLYNPLSTDQALVWYRYRDVFNSTWPVTDAEIYGSPETNPDGYYQVSPNNYLDRISMPVQLHHGDADNVVPVEWSRDLNQRLLDLGKNIEYYEYPGGPHTFVGEMYDLFLERNLVFFDTYVK